jgi:hypothetical protein
MHVMVPAGQRSLALLRGILLCAGLAYGLLTWGFVTRSNWATVLWPWPDTPLSHLFIGSVCGALAVGALWSGLSGHVHAVTGSLRGLVVIYGSIGAYLMARALSGEGSLTIHAAVAVMTACACLALQVAVGRAPRPREAQRPLEPTVRGSTGIFALALALAGTALVLRVPGIFPWPLSAQSSTVFGLVFLGLAMVYADVAVTGLREAAIVAMSGFLVYDLILLPPFIRHFGKVSPELLTSLTVYVAVLVYSALLAVWFLFRPRRSRGVQNGLSHRTGV